MYRKRIWAFFDEICWVMGALLSNCAIQIDLGLMHFHALSFLVKSQCSPLFPKKTKPKKKGGKKKTCYIYMSLHFYFPCLFLLSPQGYAGSPSPFSTSTIVLPAVLPRQVVITLTSLRTDESEYHIISVL